MLNCCIQKDYKDQKDNSFSMFHARTTLLVNLFHSVVKKKCVHEKYEACSTGPGQSCRKII